MLTRFSHENIYLLAYVSPSVPSDFNSSSPSGGDLKPNSSTASADRYFSRLIIEFEGDLTRSATVHMSAARDANAHGGSCPASSDCLLLRYPCNRSIMNAPQLLPYSYTQLHASSYLLFTRQIGRCSFTAYNPRLCPFNTTDCCWP